MRIILLVLMALLFSSCENPEPDFKVHLDCESKVFVNKEPVLEDRFRDLIRDYYIMNGSESIISIKACSETSVKPLSEIRNIIKEVVSELKSEYSQKRFKKNIDSLEKNQLTEVDKKYPLKVKFIRSE